MTWPHLWLLVVFVALCAMAAGAGGPDPGPFE